MIEALQVPKNAQSKKGKKRYLACKRVNRWSPVWGILKEKVGSTVTFFNHFRYNTKSKSLCWFVLKKPNRATWNKEKCFALQQIMRIFSLNAFILHKSMNIIEFIVFFWINFIGLPSHWVAAVFLAKFTCNFPVST